MTRCTCTVFARSGKLTVAIAHGVRIMSNDNTTHHQHQNAKPVSVAALQTWLRIVFPIKSLCLMHS